MTATGARCAVLLLTLLPLGCGGGDGPSGPANSVFTTLQLTPSTTTLFTRAPDNSVRLVSTARNQNGAAMAGVGTPSFSSSNAAIASVDGTGLVSAGQVGNATITASLTVDGVTKTAQSAITVMDAVSTATVTAPGLAFQPDRVDIATGGTVTWTMAGVEHNVTFNSGGAPANIPTLVNASASRTFPQSGSFSYTCTLHAGMTGVVHVH